MKPQDVKPQITSWILHPSQGQGFGAEAPSYAPNLELVTPLYGAEAPSYAPNLELVTP